jgi:hypothetical protein
MQGRRGGESGDTVDGLHRPVPEEEINERHA